eukprot:3278344-Lingulodinium_polyedra.AAC.1
MRSNRPRANVAACKSHARALHAHARKRRAHGTRERAIREPMCCLNPLRNCLDAAWVLLECC